MPAAYTFEMTDNTTTLDFLGTTYVGLQNSLSMPPPPKRLTWAGEGMMNDGARLTQSRYENRTIEFDLRFVATALGTLQSNIRTVESMLVTAREVEQSGRGTAVTLNIQLGTSGTDVTFRVLEGALTMPESFLDAPMVSTRTTVVPAHLRLTCHPLGQLPLVEEAAAVLENEQDGGSLNYIYITGYGGTEPGLLALTIAGSGWAGSGTMWIARRSGSGVTATLFVQGESFATAVEVTPPESAGAATFGTGAVVNATLSGGSSGVLRWTTPGNATATLTTGTFIQAGYQQYNMTGTAIPNGLFRVLVRGRPVTIFVSNLQTTAMGWGVGYTYGATTGTPSVTSGFKAFSNANQGTIETLDVSEIRIPPIPSPTGTLATAGTFGLRIYSIFNSLIAGARIGSAADPNPASAAFELDYVFLLPIDEGAVIAAGVGSGTRLLIDGISRTPGVYLTDASDVIQSYATHAGTPFAIGPGGTTRFYVLRDDIGDPTTILNTLTARHRPQVGMV